MTAVLSRRSLLAAGGGLLVFVALPGEPARADDVPLPGSLKGTPLLDAWIRIGPDGVITAFTGKAELGQGLKTALIQVIAEQLDIAPARVTLVTADTARTPNEGFTAGSHSMQDSGTALLNAAAQARLLLSRPSPPTLASRPRHSPSWTGWCTHQAARPTTTARLRRSCRCMCGHSRAVG